MSDSPQTYHKPVPQAVDFEKQILGTIILQQNEFYNVCDLLKPEVFYLSEHKVIYECIENLMKESKPVTELTLKECLKGRKPKVDLYYINKLTLNVGGSDIIYPSQVIIEKYLLREIIILTNKIQEQAFETNIDVFKLQDELLSELIRMQGFISIDDTLHIKDIIPRVVKEIEAANSETNQLGIKSSFRVVNENYGGYIPKLFYILAGRPGMGKSTFVRNEILNFAKQDIPGVYFSLEMSREEIVKCMISSDTEIYYDKFLKGGFHQDEWEKMHKSLSRIESLSIFINESAKHSINEIYLISKRLKLQHNIRYIIIDHLQLVKGDSNMLLRLTEISGMCKVMAKELDVPVIGLSQLSREVEKRDNKKPRLSDLRESGTLEQDADCVLLLYRPEYYDIQEMAGEPTEGLAKFIGGKYRQGKNSDFILNFEGHYQRFVEDKF